MSKRRFALINKAATAETNDLSATVTWANVPDANITESSVTQHQAALSVTESQISDLQSYLTSVVAGDVNAEASTDGWVLTSDGAGNAAWEAVPTGGSEINDLTAAVTWANVPNINITQASVTQHQAALSITESQISDLQSYLTAETNDLSAAVTWANVPDANVTQSSVTQHQAALTIAESQITDSTILARLAANETVSGDWTFTGGGVDIKNAGGSGLYVYGPDGSSRIYLESTNTTGYIGLANNSILALTLGITTFDFDGANLTNPGTIDGRDVAADGTTLDGIDPGVSTINTQNGAYTLVIGDKGSTIRKATSTASITHTIPANSSVAYPVGTMIAWQNDGTVNMSIAITTDTLTGTDGATGTRTLGANSAAVIQKVATTEWKYHASDI